MALWPEMNMRKDKETGGAGGGHGQLGLLYHGLLRKNKQQGRGAAEHIVTE